MTASAERPLANDVAATLAVTAFSIAVAAGFARVFSGWDFMDDLVPVAVVGHGVGLLLRRLRAPAWVAVPLGAAALMWFIAALYYRDTFSWGLPTSDTWSVFRFELDNVRDSFSHAVAPVNYGGGWDVLAAIGLGLAVFLADAFAFRAYARAETLVPGGVLFVFVGALGNDRLRIALTVVLVAVGVATTVVLRSYHSLDGARPGTIIRLRRILPAAVAATIVIALGAGLLGPRLPGAQAAPLYETHGRGGGVTEVISPLVDIRSRLTNRSNTELFQVDADIESYWRSSTLAEFDGSRWKIATQDLEDADDSLASVPLGGTPNHQWVTISGLGGSLVPAAPEPVRASGPDDLRWVAEAATLITTDDELESGDVIEVISIKPEVTATSLANATSTDAGNDIYTSLPDDLPSSVEATARQVTGDTDSPFVAARRLQTWFQSEFEYSLEVQPGHGNSAIESFLRDRVGYCEQFAGTYAAMMRTLGFPARVAVGFTSGLPLDDGTYSVLGRNAHAWPEVWFDDIGWVAFEPTPGRGSPNAEYTGLQPEQDSTPVGQTPAGQEVDAAPATTLAARPNPGELNIPEEFADPTGAGDVVTPTSDGDGDGDGVDWTSLAVLLVLALIAIAPAIIREVRSRMQSSDTEAQLARMWGDAVEAVHGAGVPIRDSDTPLEAAHATATRLPLVARPFSELAKVMTEVTYSAAGTDGYDVVGDFGSSRLRQCHNWERQITRAVSESTTLPQRVRRYFTVWR